MLTLLEAFKVLYHVAVIMAGGYFARSIYLAMKDMVLQLEAIRVKEFVGLVRWKLYLTNLSRETSTTLYSFLFSLVCLLLIIGVSIREIIEVIWA